MRFLYIISFIFFLCQCNKTDSFSEKFFLIDNNVTFGARSSLDKNVVVNSNLPWTVENDSPWLHIDPIFNTAQDSFHIRADTNYTTKKRSAIIFITSPNATNPIQLNVFQSGDIPRISFSEEDIVFEGASNLTKNITVNVNTQWSIETDVEWLSVNRISQKDTTDIIIKTLTPNHTESERTAIITIETIEGTIKTLEITQKLGITIIAGGNNLGNNLNQLSNPTSIIFNENKNGIYIVDTDNHRILEWIFDESEGKVIAGGNGVGNALNQLNNPLDIKLKDGYLYISDNMNNRILQWQLGAGAGEIVAGGDELYNPTGLDFDKDGLLLITETDSNRIKQWQIGQTTGQLIAGGTKGNSLSQLDMPFGILYDTSDNAVIIADQNNHRIVKWIIGNSEGTLLYGQNQSGEALTQFNNPISINKKPDSNLYYIADYNNHRILKYSSDETNPIAIVAGGNKAGDAINQLQQPSCVIIDTKGDVYIADSKNHRIVKYLQ